VIFHEACGHLLEASAVAKKATVMADRLGQLIAAPCVSAVDDGTLAQEWGSSQIDDEGVPTQRNLLIEDGILKSFLVDRLNGERVGLKSTGSSRRQSYRFSPTSRMNNTFILPGKDNLAEMIAGTDYGLYAKKMGGGSVNPATGEFNFAVTEGYLIRNGKIVSPIRGAVLIGRGEEILRNIDRVGSELKLAQGMCGAASGWVPVDVGQPPIRVKELLVGGR
jgi:TldD protein